MLRGFVHTAFQQITGGRGLIDPMRAHAGQEAYKKINGRPAPERFKGEASSPSIASRTSITPERGMKKISRAT